MNLLKTATCFSLVLAMGGICLGQSPGKHLFILSRQPNMTGHPPDEAFTPAVSKAFGKETVIVIQNAPC